MLPSYISFGEILWDCLPSGRHAGGAPFNVAAHLAQLGEPTALVSAVGADGLGEELLRLAEEKAVLTHFITRSASGLGTGVVQGALDAQGNATYEILQPVAWDAITVSKAAESAAQGAKALVFGSLAARSPANLEALATLLAVPGPTRFFDVNLRFPFGDPHTVFTLAKQADVLKLNEDELGLLTAWLHTGTFTHETPQDPAALPQACQVLAEATGVQTVCVTRGAAGAALWEAGQLWSAPAPPTVVRDTVGAGDAFMAGLMVGLTRGFARPHLLEKACALGAFVASQFGATPRLPTALVEGFAAVPTG